MYHALVPTSTHFYFCKQKPPGCSPPAPHGTSGGRAALLQARRGRGPSPGLPPPPALPAGTGACRPALSPWGSPTHDPQTPGPTLPGGGRGGRSIAHQLRAGAALRQSRNRRHRPPLGRPGAGEGRTDAIGQRRACGRRGWSPRQRGGAMVRAGPGRPGWVGVSPPYGALFPGPAPRRAGAPGAACWGQAAGLLLRPQQLRAGGGGLCPGGFLAPL